MPAFRHLVAGCALALLPWVAAVSPLAAQDYSGAASVFGLERVTVVYPGGSGREAETNRLSALRRAAYLEHKHGVRTEVVADVELSPAERATDLLVLGWDNRLIGTSEAPLPFARSGEARIFVGSIRVEAGQDLLFAVPSPYDPARRFVFWSRIDPELDRYLVLPFAGSDWAVYDAYTIVAQGMFEEPVTWPPKRDPYAENPQAAGRGRLRERKDSEHVSLRYDPQATSPADVERVLAAREKALAQAVALIGSPPRPLRVELYVYADLATKRAETDVADPVHSVPRRSELHMTLPFATSDNPHEEIHLVARALWGPCYHTALFEGLSLALMTPIAASDADVYAALFLERGEPPAVAELLDEEQLRRLTASGLAFPASELLVRWLLDAGGPSLVRRVYTERPLTVERLGRALERSAAETESAFRTWLEQRAAGAADELRFRSAKAEARLLADTDQWVAAIAALGRALEVRPGDFATRYQLGLAQMKVDKTAEAEATLRALTAGDVPAEALRYRIFAHYQLGRLLERQQRAAEAAAQFRRVLDFPDRHGSHRLAREALGDQSPDSEEERPRGDGGP